MTCPTCGQAVDVVTDGDGTSHYVGAEHFQRLADGAVLVRVAPEILQILEDEGSEPVVIIGIDKQRDGTYDMVLRKVECEQHS